MIDIHNHAIFGIDDGAKTIEDSIKMIDQAINIGISDIILTPHYNRKYKSMDVEDKFNKLIDYYKDKPINLHLGREYKYNALKPLKKFTLGHSNYMLIEFSTIEKEPIEEVCYNMKARGLIPIIAHIERYHYLTKTDYEEIKEVALFQVNSESVLGISSYRKDKKITKYLLKKGYVDFIASDAHNDTNRGNTLDKAYLYILKKFGKQLAEDLFINNPKKIIETHI
ncbi:MAG: CpsB/CapC family capsule biosynthesis tyrosine phosphatase [Acholeplasmataceae bacterium]